MGKYLLVAINNIKRNFTYRVNVIITVFSIFISFIALFYFWTSIYKQGNQIGDYTMQQMITYYIFAAIFQLFVTGDNAAWSVGEEIKRGQINISILKPIDYLKFKMAQSFGGLAFRVMTFSPVVLILFWILGDYIQKLQNPMVYFAFILFAIISYVLYFLIYFTIGVLGFWFAETSSFFYACVVFINFLQGGMMPLDILPGWLVSISSILPFKYLFFIPVSLVSGRMQFEYSLFIIPIIWCVLIYILAQFTYKKGIKRYEGFGI